MNYIKVIDSFISEEDRKITIDIIDQLMLSQDLDSSKPGYDGRFVFFRPDSEQSINIIKKYSSKAIESYDYAKDAVVHDVIFAKSLPGAKLDIHMDFDNTDACSECAYASVIYLNRDYTGADIFFPHLKETYSPEAGSVALFPQNNVRYAHGVTELLSGERYIVNICYTKDVARQLDLYK